MEPDRSRERIITLVVVAGAVLFVFLQLQPGMLFKHTTPTGSDLGGHVWEPNYLRGHLLTKGRLTGWSPAWHAGVPALVFYFPFPALVIAVLSAVLPYTITFKLVLALSLMSLPVVAWAFGRLSGLRFPAPALMAVVAVPFAFDHFQPQTRGGDVISTLRGEYAFAVGLPLALLFIGVLGRALDTRRHRAAAAVLLGLVVLSHIFTMLFALAGAAVLVLVRPSRRRSSTLRSSSSRVGCSRGSGWSRCAGDMGTRHPACTTMSAITSRTSFRSPAAARPGVSANPASS